MYFPSARLTVSGMDALMQCESVAEAKAWPRKPRRQRISISDDFFDEGNKVCSMAHKQLAVEKRRDSDGSSHRLQRKQFPCQVRQCDQVFDCLAHYEVHYNSTHRNLCRECRRCFPTGHLLDLHLEEWHDPVFALKALQESMYKCYVAECTERFPTAKDRRHHAVTVHKFPADFRFDKPARKKKGAHGQPGPAMASDDPTSDTNSEASDSRLSRDSSSASLQEMDAQQTVDTTAPPPPRFVYKNAVPKTVCFGAGAQRGFARRGGGRGRGGQRAQHWHAKAESSDKTKVNIEDVDMGDLTDALQVT